MGKDPLENYELYFSDLVLEKLRSRGITADDVELAFNNHLGSYLYDEDAENVVWFIGIDAQERLLKIVLDLKREWKIGAVKTAFLAGEKEINIYETNR